MSFLRKALLPIGIVCVCTASITEQAFAQERYLDFDKPSENSTTGFLLSSGRGTIILLWLVGVTGEETEATDRAAMRCYPRGSQPLGRCTLVAMAPPFRETYLE